MARAQARGVRAKARAGARLDLKRIDPSCRAVLQEGQGRLWPEDLKRLDRFCDRYLNADFYNNKVTSEAILKFWVSRYPRKAGSRTRPHEVYCNNGGEF